MFGAAWRTCTMPLLESSMVFFKAERSPWKHRLHGKCFECPNGGQKFQRFNGAEVFKFI